MDNITTYFDQIKDIPLLDEETEKDLIKETENLYDLKLISTNTRIGNFSNLSFKVRFLNEKYTEESIRNAVCIGGDSDTIGAMAGSIAEAYYGVSYDMEDEALEYLSEGLKSIYFAFNTIKGKIRKRN